MKRIKKIISNLDSLYQESATEYLDMEITEMESIFNILSVGFLFGHPLIPLHISLDILQDIDPESLQININKASLSSHPFSYLFSTFDIG